MSRDRSAARLRARAVGSGGRRRARALLAVVVFLLPAACLRGPSAERGPTNVLLLTVDTLRADHLSCYGYGRDVSPAIDGLASQGVLFERAMAQRGSTWPSVESIMTSMYPGTHGVRANGQELPPSRTTLAQRLRARGFRTAAFITNMLTAPNRGFDVKETFSGDDRDDRAVEATMRWLEAGPEEPFFLWVHLFAPHAGYHPPEPFKSRFVDPGYAGDLTGSARQLRRITLEGREVSAADLDHLISRYDGEVAYADASVGRMLDALRVHGLEDRTLVAFTADHGEELYQRNRYFFHALSIYDSVLHIPLILRLPGVLPAGIRVDEVVESVDIAPTVLEVLGLRLPEEFQGHGLLELIESPSPPTGTTSEGMAFSERGRALASVRTGRWRLVVNEGIEDEAARRQLDVYYPVAPEELYDLDGDPSESRDVAARHPEVAARLRRAILAWRARTDLAADLGYDLDPEALRELRALGYVR